MEDVKLCVHGLPQALRFLRQSGLPAEGELTRGVTHLLLPVPVLEGEKLTELMKRVPPSVTLLGGRLNQPMFSDFTKIDLLEDECYLAENAALTAVCALRLAGQLLPVQLRALPVLVIGWGRIGQCLARLLNLAGAKVFVAARKESARAMIRALGCEDLTIEEAAAALPRFRVIFNTVPAPVLSMEQLRPCPAECLQIDLASVRGMDGPQVIHARGLPGKMLPESAGQLIAKTVLRLLTKEGTP